MKDLFSLVFLIFTTIVLSAQEGFWSIDQLATLQPKLAAAGLPFSSTKIRSAQQLGFAQAVIRLPQGNAVFVNDRSLAIGALPSHIIPDSIWSQMENGVWLAKAGQGIRLMDGFPEVFLTSSQIPKPAVPRLGASVSLYFSEYNRAVDAKGQEWYNQVYQLLGNAEIIGVIRFPEQAKVAQQVCVLLRIKKNPIQLLDSLTFIPWRNTEPGDTPHLVLGFPQSSSIHRPGYELDYALALSKYHQDLDRALGEYLTRAPFITEEGVFRRYESIQVLEQTLPKRALWEAEFRHQLSSNPQLKARYGSILDSSRVAFQELKRYAPAQVYTKGLVYSPCSFFEAVRLFTMWRGRIGAPTHRLPSLAESEYFPEVFKRLPPTENELLLPELLQRYFTQLPAAQLSPYAIRQAIYAQKDYAKLSQTLLIQSKFSQPDEIADLLNEDFLQNIDLIASDPAVQLVDSILHFYATQVVPKMEKARYKAFQKADELAKAMSEVLPDYPAYPEADHSLRLSYGTKLQNPGDGSGYWLSNAHLLEDHLGSPAIDSKGQLVGLVMGLSPESSNAYFYDPSKYPALIWSIVNIRDRIASHSLGLDLMREWP